MIKSINTRFFLLLFCFLISIPLCIASGSQIVGSEPKDKLSWFANVSDLIVYGKTSDNEMKWSDIGIITVNYLFVQKIITQNNSSNITEGSSIPIYIEGGKVDDPVQAAAHFGIYGQTADWEWGINPNTTLVYFLKKSNNGMYHLYYSETVDPDSEYFRSNLTELKVLIGEIIQGHPVLERTYKHE